MSDDQISQYFCTYFVAGEDCSHCRLYLNISGTLFLLRSIHECPTTIINPEPQHIFPKVSLGANKTCPTATPQFLWSCHENKCSIKCGGVNQYKCLVFFFVRFTSIFCRGELFFSHIKLHWFRQVKSEGFCLVWMWVYVVMLAQNTVTKECMKFSKWTMAFFMPHCVIPLVFFIYSTIKGAHKCISKFWVRPGMRSKPKYFLFKPTSWLFLKVPCRHLCSGWI